MKALIASIATALVMAVGSFAGAFDGMIEGNVKCVIDDPVASHVVIVRSGAAAPRTVAYSWQDDGELVFERSVGRDVRHLVRSAPGYGLTKVCG